MASYLFCWFAAQAEFYIHLCCCLAPMPYLADVSCKDQFFLRVGVRQLSALPCLFLLLHHTIFQVGNKLVSQKKN